jgi:hypothetical protein
MSLTGDWDHVYCVCISGGQVYNDEHEPRPAASAPMNAKRTGVMVLTADLRTVRSH